MASVGVVIVRVVQGTEANTGSYSGRDGGRSNSFVGLVHVEILGRRSSVSSILVQFEGRGAVGVVGPVLIAKLLSVVVRITSRRNVCITSVTIARSAVLIVS